jgi:hypothetical protein
MTNVELRNSIYFIFKKVERNDIHNSSIDIRYYAVRFTIEYQKKGVI